jgi:hypothetical protein
MVKAKTDGVCNVVAGRCDTDPYTQTMSCLSAHSLGQGRTLLQVCRYGYRLHISLVKGVNGLKMVQHSPFTLVHGVEVESQNRNI